MENMGIDSCFWRGKRVFVTGHTGFKGSWLCLWLEHLGAVVTGFALPPDTTPSLFKLAQIDSGISSHFGDIRDFEGLRVVMSAADPEIVFHLAAQPLVRVSYRQPVMTFSTNVMGTAHVLEAARECFGLKVIQVITTDKVYENGEWPWPYRETDPLGGHDPYSASKAACELVVASYRQSFFSTSKISVSTARAGNIIGGGDWAEDRLLPDCIRAFQAGRPVVLRQPGSIRPWQQVLEPLSGYLRLAQLQWNELRDGVDRRYARAFNFGPDASAETTAGRIAGMAAEAWGDRAEVVDDVPVDGPHEAGVLSLDPSLVRKMLGWRTRMSTAEAVKLSVDWYKGWHAGESTRQLCLGQIADYSRRVI